MWNTIWPISSNIFGDYKMNNNEILARWQGWSQAIGVPDHQQARWSTGRGKLRILPDYLNDAAACDSLLDTLVEKGYIPQLFYNTFWHFEVYSDNEFIFRTFKYTRREAIIAVCLEVARKEIEENTNAKKSCTT